MTAEVEASLYRRFAPRIRGYGRKHLRLEAPAADLVQDVLVIVLGALRAGRVDDGPDLARFVLATCRNLVSDASRSARRRERILAAVEPEPAAGADAPALDHDRLRRCLESLAERERAILIMTFYDDRSADEIAKEMTLSAGNVRVVRHRALLQVRRCVDAGGPP